MTPSDLPRIYESPDGKGIRDITTEFWYDPAEPKTRDITPGEWKRVMGDVAKQIPEQILFTSGGTVTSNFTTANQTDDLVEVFSPPRVLGPGAQPRIVGDLALDLKTGWDCRKKEDRMWALAEVKRRKPKVVGLTPPCQMCCALQNLSIGAGAEEWEKQYKEALLFLRFAIRVAKMQLDA